MGQESESAQSAYRLFWTNGAGRIVGAPVIIEAADDDGALSQATALAGERPAELWLNARCVTTLNAAQHGGR